MDDLLAQVLSFPPSSPASDVEYDKQARALVQKLENTSSSKLSGRSGGESLLELLNPADHTIAYVAVLSACVEGVQSKASQQLHKDLLPNGGLFPKIVQFLENFDPIQIRYVGSAFRSLLGVVEQAADQSSQPWLAVPILRDVILRIDPTSSTLSSTHIDFILRCLRLKLYRDALPILDLNIYNIPPTRQQRPLGKTALPCAQTSSASFLTPATGLTATMTPRAFMQYFLFASLIHIALRQWERALLFLEIVLRVPSSHTASMVMVEAYKKYVLIGLLLKGKHLSPPKSTNSQALKHIRAMARPYDVIGESFDSHDRQRLQSDIEVGQREGIWQRDNNLGLIHEVLQAFRKFSVLRLGETFSALPLAEVARRTSPDPSNLLEIEQYVSNLIITGELKASISQDASNNNSFLTLRFLTSSSTTKSEKQLHADLEKQKLKLTALLELISSDDHRLEISREYVEFLQKLKKGKDEEEKANRQASGASTSNDLSTSTRRPGGSVGTADAAAAALAGFQREMMMEEDEDVMADS